MKKITVKLNLADDTTIEEAAERIQVMDQYPTLTLSHDFGPHIRIMENGKVGLTIDGSTREYAYTEGLLKAENNICVIDLLK